MSKKFIILACALFLIKSVSIFAAEFDTEKTDTTVRNFNAFRRHMLREYGTYKTLNEFAKTFKKGIEELKKQGGGVLVIPSDAPGFYSGKGIAIKNTFQKEFNAPGITIIDYRNGIEKKYVPPIGESCNNPWLGGASSTIERYLNKNLPWQNTYTTQKIVSEYVGGASSYLDYLSEAVEAGKNQRLYIPSLKGLFIGQTLAVSGVANGYGGKNNEIIKVKKIGVDKNNKPFFTADLKNSHLQKAIIYNKNVVNGLTVNDISSCDNQSMSLVIDRKTYGQGDSFGISTLLNYQGGFMSAGGDEGGVAYTAELVQDLAVFQGKVESWKPGTGKLVYKPGAINSQKLGTSRPLINMNENKWIRSGKIMVIAPGNAYLRKKTSSSSIIIGSKETKWDENIIGRFIAIDDKSEYYDKNEATTYGYGNAANGYKKYRWWQITALEKREDGLSNLYVSRVWWKTIVKAGPTLFLYDNYTISHNHVKKLSYIIAPGGWASDVRNGISGKLPGTLGIARKSENRTIILGVAGKNAAIFSPGDPITQPASADAWLPTGYRVRHFNAFPGMIGGASFAAVNAGRVQVGTGLDISGGAIVLEDAINRQKDKKPVFGRAINIMASTEEAIRIRGPVQNAAFDLWQYDGNIKRITWRLPYNKAKMSTASFYADPKNGNFVFQGRNISLNNQGSILQKGISATGISANNLRGINVSVEAGNKSIKINFTQPEKDNNYSLTAQPNWFTMDKVSVKTKKGFTLEFSTSAPANAKIDWQLIR